MDPEVTIFPSITEGELSKVEHLALHRQIIENTPHPQEFTLCLLVDRIFRNAKTLTVVTERHKKEPFAQEDDKDESQELASMDPVDIRRRWYMFQHPNFHVRHETIPADIPDIHYWVKPDNTSDLDAARSYYEAEFGIEIGSFTMPTIDYKILTTSKIKKELERLQQEYERVCICRCYEKESVVVTEEWYWAEQTGTWSDFDEDDL